MTRRRPIPQRRRSRSTGNRPIIAFLLVASFGILFAGCSQPAPMPEEGSDEFVFTEQDLERIQELADEAKEEVNAGDHGTGSVVPYLEEDTTEDAIVVDLTNVDLYNTIRDAQADASGYYAVTNDFLNIRSEPSVRGAILGKMKKGERIDVVDFIDNAWVKIRYQDQDAMVAKRYISKVVSEDRFTEEKAAFDGLYFVDFGFLNVRKQPDTTSEKIGELAGQTIVRPLSMDEVWARIMIDGKEGYVAQEYLTPFAPNFLVRQSKYSIPILRYRAGKEGVMTSLLQDVDLLSQEGYSFATLRALRATLIEQQKKDVRTDPRTVIVAVSNVRAANMKEVSDTLIAAGIPATLFIPTQEIGIGGITEKQLITLRANGFDIQSGGHTGDDLRALTSPQIELELKESRQILEEILGDEVFAIAYPLGGANDRVKNIAANLGYLFGVGTDPQISFTRKQLLLMPSIIVNSAMTPEDVLAIITGEKEYQPE